MQKISMNQQIIVLLANLIDYEKLRRVAPDWDDIRDDHFSCCSEHIVDSDAIGADDELGRACEEAERLTKIEFVREWLAKLSDVPTIDPVSA